MTKPTRAETRAYARGYRAGLVDAAEQLQRALTALAEKLDEASELAPELTEERETLPEIRAEHVTLTDGEAPR
jgi:hypothetical protein